MGGRGIEGGARRDKSGAQQMGGGGVFFCLFLRILKNPLIWFSIGVKKDPLSSSKSILSDFGGASVLWTLRFTGAAVPKISKIVFCVSTDPGAPVGGMDPQVMSQLFVLDLFNPNVAPFNPGFTPLPV